MQFYILVVTLQTHHTCRYLVSVQEKSHQCSDSNHMISAYYSLSTTGRWKAELAQLADPQRTVYPYKWLPISCRSGAGQWKVKGRRSETDVIPLSYTANYTTRWEVLADRPVGEATSDKLIATDVKVRQCASVGL